MPPLLSPSAPHLLPSARALASAERTNKACSCSTSILARETPSALSFLFLSEHLELQNQQIILIPYCSDFHLEFALRISVTLPSFLVLFACWIAASFSITTHSPTSWSSPSLTRLRFLFLRAVSAPILQCQPVLVTAVPMMLNLFLFLLLLHQLFFVYSSSFLLASGAAEGLTWLLKWCSFICALFYINSSSCFDCVLIAFLVAVTMPSPLAAPIITIDYSSCHQEHRKASHSLLRKPSSPITNSSSSV